MTSRLPGLRPRHGPPGARLPAHPSPTRRRVLDWNDVHDTWALEYDCPKCRARNGQLCSISESDDEITDTSPVKEWSLGWQTHYERVCLTGFEMRGGSGEVGATR